MRPLSKSRFKLALDCPTKLYYTKKSKYENQQESDSFMEALAEGGYQVGELAKCYYTGGHDITETGYDSPLKRTNDLLQQENVIIYEAAILYDNLFIRVDVIQKIGNQINLIEVKAKSFDGNGSASFLNKSGYVDSKWNPYLQDVAFQKYVTEKAFPKCYVTAFLMLADKSETASVSGLNQLFQIKTNGEGRKYVEVSKGVSTASLGTQILTAVNVDDIVQRIIDDEDQKDKPEILFEEKIKLWADKYAKDEKIISPIGVHCFGCEFQGNNPKKLSGLKECWKHQTNWTDSDFEKPRTTDIWNFRKKVKLFEEEQIIFMEEVHEHHIADKVEPKANGALSSSERQWKQVEKVQNNDDSFYLDRDRMKAEMDTFTYPLHFIDFETSMVAIPFYKGQRPYEQIAFQFSHHVVHADGKIEHKGEFIETGKGVFPNFSFVRALKEQLSGGEGTIFRFAAHENTVLNQIYAQLLEVNSAAVPDKNQLMDFIRTITNWEISKNKKKHGPRDMVDMNRMVKDYFYDPRAKGSNSIKAVLPAVLSRSAFIQEKYAKPIYGKTGKIKSLNFEDGWIWIQNDEAGKVSNPYELLPSIFEDLSEDEKKELIASESIADGGAAMTAFAKIQFADITTLERVRIVKGLLKYCELDTLAMVMIYEFWMDEIS
jgi:hypothetical protein